MLPLSGVKISSIKAAAKSFLQNIPFSLSAHPYSDSLFVSDGSNWSLNWDAMEIGNISEQLGIDSRYSGPIPMALPYQSIFFFSRSFLKNPSRYLMGNSRIAFPYYHGYPDSENGEFRHVFKNLKKYHGKISRIQVTHSKMHRLILATGIDPAKVFLIPIGINPLFFSCQSGGKRKMRKKYGIPEQAVVIGSFQKDGNGWEDGLEPKFIKGPDVFLKTIKKLKESIPELYILLSGPARGYVIKGLKEMKVPYTHIFLDHYPDIGNLYQCLDLYVIASREEGGPKAVLESMISGVPLVTTRVGQAMDLVEHGKNGFMVDIEDADGLAYWSKKILSDPELAVSVAKHGIDTADKHTYEAQKPLWKDFFDGFVNRKSN